MTSQIAPRSFWMTLLTDALPLLEQKQVRLHQPQQGVFCALPGSVAMQMLVCASSQGVLCMQVHHKAHERKPKVMLSANGASPEWMGGQETRNHGSILPNGNSQEFGHWLFLGNS